MSFPFRRGEVLHTAGKAAAGKRWSRGKDGPIESRKSEGHVPIHPALACHLSAWKAITPYARETDFVFPSLKSEGRVPLSPVIFVADHLRPAAIKAGVQVPDGLRFGFQHAAQPQSLAGQ